MKSPKPLKQSHTGTKKGGPFAGDWHVSHTGMGMGDYYGTGIKAKLGKMRDSYTPPVNDTSKKKLKIPPRSVV